MGVGGVSSLAPGESWLVPGEVAPAPGTQGHEGASLPPPRHCLRAISVALSPWASTSWIFSWPWSDGDQPALHC